MVTWLWRRFLRVVLPPSPPPTPSDDPTSEQVFYDAAARFLDLQISTDDVIDREALTAFTIASTVLPLTFGFLNLGPNRAPDKAVSFFTAALVFYGLVLLCSFRVSMFRGLEFRPHLPTLRNHSYKYEGDVLRRWVAEEYLASPEKNRQVLERKARWSGATFIALYFEAGCLASAALVTLL